MTTASTTTISRVSRRAAAYHAIRELLLTNELEPGSTFTEGQLAEQLGMSTVPVREALLLLAGHHLVTAKHGAGYTVATITRQSARDAYRVRLLLEGEAVRRAGRDDAERTAAHLRKIAAGSPQERERLFHVHVGQHSGNVRLCHALELALMETERAERLVGFAAPHSDHVAMVAAIRRGDVAHASRLVSQHIRAAEREVLRALSA